jgi:glycosyltransferase involved in cell wall biosynthesis
MARWRPYPYSADTVKAFYRRSPLGWVKTLWEDKVVRRRLRSAPIDAPINLLTPGTFRPLEERDLPLVVVARNEMKFLPSFLAHYRKLGVSRFIFVDDRSDDGSREYLADQADVDVWTSPLRYSEARCGSGGILWREAAVARYGRNRWYLHVDSDEYLVYPGDDSRSLRDVVSLLEAKGVKRLAAPMIDMYPAAPLHGAALDHVGRMPWDVADHFDGEGYQVRMRNRNMKLIGGPRNRKFQLPNQLMKYPLSFWDDATSYRAGIHMPLPFHRNFSPMHGVLLHFKFLADFEKEMTEAIADGQHYDNAREYRVIAQAINQQGDLNFMDKVSVRYEGPEQMAERGFMQSIWNRK